MDKDERRDEIRRLLDELGMKQPQISYLWNDPRNYHPVPFRCCLDQPHKKERTMNKQKFKKKLQGFINDFNKAESVTGTITGHHVASDNAAVLFVDSYGQTYCIPVFQKMNELFVGIGDRALDLGVVNIESAIMRAQVAYDTATWSEEELAELEKTVAEECAAEDPDLDFSDDPDLLGAD